jgi:hypothetical protein
MKIASERSDAIELMKDIKKQMSIVRELLAELEYLVYEKDDRVSIEFFERGDHDKGRSEKRAATNKRDGS